MRVVVIGATGNVGTSLLPLLSHTTEIETIVGIARRRPELDLPKVSWVEADVASDDLHRLVAGADAVVHLAWLIQPARRTELLRMVNVVGTQRLLRAVADEGVPALVVASSVGAYSPGPKERRVDESWPVGGTPTCGYARQKAAVEALLDRFESQHPDTRVVRMRTGLVFKREAASEIARYFLGPLVPRTLVRRPVIQLVPKAPGLVVQGVHAEDAGAAYRAAVVRDVRGPFNVAAEPPLDGDLAARVLGASTVFVGRQTLRAGAALSHRLRLQPTPPGWLDMAFSVPLMDSSRARSDLGWEPARGADDAFLDLVEGMRERAGLPTPPMDPATSAPMPTTQGGSR